MSLTYPSNKICPRCKTAGYVWYMDNSEYVAKCTNCGHYFRKGDFPMCVLDGETKQMTWGDKIRAMSDEELAEFFGTLPCCPPGSAEELCYPENTCGADTKMMVKCWGTWLKATVEVDDEPC